jgi:hypothetical protein
VQKHAKTVSTVTAKRMALITGPKNMAKHQKNLVAILMFGNIKT